MLAVHLALTGLPAVAAALLAAERGVRSVPVLLAIALAATGLAALLGFWLYYGDPLVGETFSYLLLFGSVALVARLLVGRRVAPELLHQLATPFALWALGSGFLLFLGFLHGGTAEPLEMAKTRFSHLLPGDNEIPLFFGEWFFDHGHQGTPPVYPGEWLSSDRPPLQTGFFLAQRPFFVGDNVLQYQVLGVVLQQLWIVGLWALLLAAGVRRVGRGLAMVAVLLSSLTIINGFYVWPKMLPAAMLLAVAALVITPLWRQVSRSLWGAALVAALAGLAMMGHGSSVFGILPLALVAAFRGLPSWRWLAVGLAVGFTLIASWSAYQSYGDPPGNRLTKWMLAGVLEIDERGTLQAVGDSYGDLSVGEVIDHKAKNFETMIGGKPAVDDSRDAINALGDGDLETAVREVRLIDFFNLFPSLGLLLIAPVVMAATRLRRRVASAEWSLALACFAVVALGCVSWGLLIFGNEVALTVIHVGSYLLPALAICGAVVGLRAVAPRFAVYLVSASCVLTLAIYVPSFDPLPDTGYSIVGAALATAGLAGFCLVALRPGPSAQAAAADDLPARVARHSPGEPHGAR
jgi:hypothetical protein